MFLCPRAVYWHERENDFGTARQDHCNPAKYGQDHRDTARFSQAPLADCLVNFMGVAIDRSGGQNYIQSMTNTDLLLKETKKIGYEYC